MDKKKLKRLVFGEFSLKRLMRSAIFIYAFLCFYAYFFSDRMIFVPQPSSYRDSSEILKLTTTDGVQISAAYLPNPNATYTILYSHGNAEDLFDVLSVRQGLRDMGFEVFAYDYRGYGTSQGTPTERNSYRDIDAAYTYLTQQLGVPPNRIIAYGRSVGSGPAVDLASRQPLAGLIVESAFITAFRVLTRIPIVPFDRFRNLDKIKKVRCPVLVMHGRRDEVIPFWHGEQLFAAANEPKRFLWVDEAGHNDFGWVAAQKSEKAVREFAQLVEQSQRNLPRG
ncbi:alpha/beta hydrolase [Coleofasciculus sp. FACHB-542]|uniref:alpha/beta hydrolase n=1 Tax=Coleofasciculus sp. FACHB-542 TaxID=2692787 RepID=UPI001685930A|nr:alpha/beta hydrolase [Coleofasciculus sp. FACHB-542]MBD2086079.1 alpha/beta hydrolase [Coleofasciculus sp. FACHB-542]